MASTASMIIYPAVTSQSIARMTSILNAEWIAHTGHNVLHSYYQWGSDQSCQWRRQTWDGKPRTVQGQAKTSSLNSGRTFTTLIWKSPGHVHSSVSSTTTMTSSLFFQLLFCFIVFTHVLSIPIPPDVAFPKRTTSARDVYDALKTLDEELTFVLPQIGGSYILRKPLTILTRHNRDGLQFIQHRTDKIGCLHPHLRHPIGPVSYPWTYFIHIWSPIEE